MQKIILLQMVLNQDMLTLKLINVRVIKTAKGDDRKIYRLINKNNI